MEEMDSGKEEHTNEFTARKTLGHPHRVLPVLRDVSTVKDIGGSHAET